MHHDRTTTVALVLLTSIGCSGFGDAPPDNGIRVWCDGSQAGATDPERLGFWERNIYCNDADCFNKRTNFKLCIDPNAAMGDTGIFDDEDWVNDTESIDFIRGQCIAECDAHNSTLAANVGLVKKCDDAEEKYIIRNYELLPTPDDGNAISDPGHLECSLSENSNLQPKPDPLDVAVIASGTSPRWPSNSDYIELVCDNYKDCSEEFAAPILGYLFYEDDNGDWGNDMGRADYLAITGTGTSTDLALSIHNPVYGLSTETNDAEGRIEYSAPNCGETECPIYISNMTLSNNSDTWDLWSDSLNENIDVTDVWVRLRRPVLGVWNTSSDEVYIGEGMMEFYIEADVKVGSVGPATTSFFAVNNDDIFGEIGSGGAVSFFSLAADNGNGLEMEADLDYDQRTDGPPTADIGLFSTVTAPTGSGLPISGISDSSSDPDNDLGYKLWIVDGTQRPTSYVIPIGSHSIRLEVEDERGAFDDDEQTVIIVAP